MYITHNFKKSKNYKIYANWDKKHVNRCEKWDEWQCYLIEIAKILKTMLSRFSLGLYSGSL